MGRGEREDWRARGEGRTCNHTVNVMFILNTRLNTVRY